MSNLRELMRLEKARRILEKKAKEQAAEKQKGLQDASLSTPPPPPVHGKQNKLDFSSNFCSPSANVNQTKNTSFERNEKKRKEGGDVNEKIKLRRSENEVQGDKKKGGEDDENEVTNGKGLASVLGYEYSEEEQEEEEKEEENMEKAEEKAEENKCLNGIERTSRRYSAAGNFTQKQFLEKNDKYAEDAELKEEHSELDEHSKNICVNKSGNLFDYEKELKAGEEKSERANGGISIPVSSSSPPPVPAGIPLDFFDAEIKENEEGENEEKVDEAKYRNEEKNKNRNYNDESDSTFSFAVPPPVSSLYPKSSFVPPAPPSSPSSAAFRSSGQQAFSFFSSSSDSSSTHDSSSEVNLAETKAPLEEYEILEADPSLLLPLSSSFSTSSFSVTSGSLSSSKDAVSFSSAISVGMPISPNLPRAVLLNEMDIYRPTDTAIISELRHEEEMEEKGEEEKEGEIKISENVEQKKQEKKNEALLLPRGFYDDAEIDAKVRGEEGPQKKEEKRKIRRKKIMEAMEDLIILKKLYKLEEEDKRRMEEEMFEEEEICESWQRKLQQIKQQKMEVSAALSFSSLSSVKKEEKEISGLSGREDVQEGEGLEQIQIKGGGINTKKEDNNIFGGGDIKMEEEKNRNLRDIRVKNEIEEKKEENEEEDENEEEEEEEDEGDDYELDWRAKKI